MPAIIGDETILQRVLSGQLQLGVDGRANGQAALLQRVFAIGFDQVAAQLLHEIGRSGIFRPLQAARGRQRLGHRLFRSFALDIAILDHAAQDIVAPLQQAFGPAVRVH